MECQITETSPSEVKQEESQVPEKDAKKVITETEQIGSKLLKVQFIEFVGKRRKKVTHIEVTQAELKDLLKNSEKDVVAQLSMF
jgi:hypothetical protein